jgi:hypothetical protein
VYLWENLEAVRTLTDEYREMAITCIATSNEALVIGTDSSTIHLWDLAFQNNLENFELDNFGIKLFSYEITDMYFSYLNSFIKHRCRRDVLGDYKRRRHRGDLKGKEAS